MCARSGASLAPPQQAGWLPASRCACCYGGGPLLEVQLLAAGACILLPACCHLHSHMMRFCPTLGFVNFKTLSL
jgi:hypothetical protein